MAGTVASLALTLCTLLSTAYCYNYSTERFRVPVDHFSFAVNDTFEIRYLVNADHWREDGGPIFFYTGNEGDITMFAENTEPKYLGYLTSQQALADYADLIKYLTANQTEYNKSPVIAFGGSYGGMLAAWFRMKYPHIVAGSIAASAPILQFTGLTPCEAFYRIVTSDFEAASSECSNSIRKSWKAINNVTSSDGGRAWLSSAWQLCKPLQKQGDVSALKDWLIDIYTNMAMLNYPYPTNFLAPLPAKPIKVACQFLPDSKQEEKPLLQSLFKAISVYTNYTGKTKCLDIGEDATSDLGERGWDFQACTEMVMPMCSDGRHDMFEKKAWDFTQYSDTCYKKWKVRPQPDLAVKIYGGKDISTTSNIIFSNGLLDPWSSGGVLRSMSTSVRAVIIPEGAHHLDLRASNPADPTSVIEARRAYQYFISTWIKQYRKQQTKKKRLLSRNTTE
ncbi:lysosomal Pro-X carboxypeptidase isoform X2 [Anabrus simplex]|uniref:lysosomal Pro-X carboxypeptidase isoform X2 n=1 Tax=Anabrus simplex TaxID=316456 RepID=UPI0035A3BA03